MFRLIIWPCLWLVALRVHFSGGDAVTPKYGDDPLKKEDYLNIEKADQITDNILSRVKYLVDSEIDTNNTPSHNNSDKATGNTSTKPLETRRSKLTKEDRNITSQLVQFGILNKTLLCPNTSDCEKLSPREAKTIKTLAFLAGLKFGKHFLQGVQAGIGFQNSGSFSAANSLTLFGKVLNTALSVSYGTPLLDDLAADHPPPLPPQGLYLSPPSGPSNLQVVSAVKAPFQDQPPAVSVLNLLSSSPTPPRPQGGSSEDSGPVENVVPSATVSTTTTPATVASDAEASFKASPEFGDGNEEIVSLPLEAVQLADTEPTATDKQEDHELGTKNTPLPSLTTLPLDLDDQKTAESSQKSQVIASRRQSQSKTREQLINESRRKFLLEHNERFRKLVKQSAKKTTPPQFHIILY